MLKQRTRGNKHLLSFPPQILRTTHRLRWDTGSHHVGYVCLVKEWLLTFRVGSFWWGKKRTKTTGCLSHRCSHLNDIQPQCRQSASLYHNVRQMITWQQSHWKEGCVHCHSAWKLQCELDWLVKCRIPVPEIPPSSELIEHYRFSQACELVWFSKHGAHLNLRACLSSIYRCIHSIQGAPIPHKAFRVIVNTCHDATQQQPNADWI